MRRVHIIKINQRMKARTKGKNLTMYVSYLKDALTDALVL